jgi:hypothetical protein
MRGVLRHGERRLRRRRPPGLDPGRTAGSQFGDDLAGDSGIETCPILAGTGASGVSGLAELRDGRREPLSRPSTRHGKPGPPLTLGGVAGLPGRRLCAGDRGARQGKAFPSHLPAFSKAAEP